MVMEIAKYGADVLRQKCFSVDHFDDQVRELVDSLFASMWTARGVGLAAPQIGVRQRVIVVDVSKQEPRHPPIALINPVITAASGAAIGEEGCLSFPDLYADVKRYERIAVEGLAVDGQRLDLDAEGFYARALQHEIDHLDGKLFIDHLRPLKRQLLRGTLKRLQKEGEAWNRVRFAVADIDNELLNR